METPGTGHGRVFGPFPLRFPAGHPFWPPISKALYGRWWVLTHKWGPPTCVWEWGNRPMGWGGEWGRGGVRWPRVTQFQTKINKSGNLAPARKRITNVTHAHRCSPRAAACPAVWPVAAARCCWRRRSSTPWHRCCPGRQAFRTPLGSAATSTPPRRSHRSLRTTGRRRPRRRCARGAVRTCSSSSLTTLARSWDATGTPSCGPRTWTSSQPAAHSSAALIRSTQSARHRATPVSDGLRS